MMKHLCIDAFDRVAPRICNRVRVERRLWKKAFGEPEVSLVSSLCDRSKMAIDVGAAGGDYAYVMSKYAKLVHAFEPSATACRHLKRRMPDNVEIHNLALSHQRGVAELRMPRLASQLATIETGNPLTVAKGNVDIFRVLTERLDAFGFNDVAFIKIDVEGHELSVIKGSRETIIRNRPALLVEIEDRHSPYPIEATVDHLATYGYLCFFLDSGAMRSFDQFSIENDQNINNVSIRGKEGRYINNFMFVFGDRLNKLSKYLNVHA